MSGLDSAFLALETPSTPMHVLGVARIDTRDTDAEQFHRRFRDRLGERLDALPMLRRKLAPGPFIADGAAWVVDTELDLDWHLRRAALHSPGDERALCEFVGGIASLPLDRSRPLWEMWLVEGLEHGGTALVAKMHHALVDGFGGAAIFATLCDPEPAPAGAHAHERAPDVADSASRTDDTSAFDSSVWQVPARALRSTLTLPFKVTRQALRTANVLIGLAVDRFARPSNERGALPFSGADTRINQAVTTDRAVAFAALPMDDIQAIREAFDGVTVNDVVLAGCTGALREYLAQVDRVPDAPLVAAVPVSIDRRVAAGANAVSSLLVHLPVHEPDLAAQLGQVRAATRAAKRTHERMHPGLISEWAEAAPGFLLDGLSSLYAKLDLADRHAPPYNLVVSNVRGPEHTLRCLGARVEACHPLGPIYENAGLNLTVMSYGGRLLLGALGCPRTTPDLHRLTDLFVEHIARLERALRRRPSPAASPRREPLAERLRSAAPARAGIRVIVR